MGTTSPSCSNFVVYRKSATAFLVAWALLAEGTQYVTADIYGQMGNQMFQVAAALSYALDHGAEASFPDLPSAINGELNCKTVFHRVKTDPFPPDAEFHCHDQNLVVENFYYAPIPDFGSENVRLHAHFNSEKYFIQHEEAIRELFAPSEEIKTEILSKYGHLLSGTTVAVHVRTFLPDGHSEPMHVPRNLVHYRWHYYNQAMDAFPKDALFLIFSDDVEWTRRNFRPSRSNVIFIDGNPHYIDFYLMSFCDHQIVSYDSTYSWWAAWLNTNPEKTVIIPDTAGGCPNPDYLPASWKKIPRFPPNVQRS